MSANSVHGFGILKRNLAPVIGGTRDEHQSPRMENGKLDLGAEEPSGGRVVGPGRLPSSWTADGRCRFEGLWRTLVARKRVKSCMYVFIETLSCPRTMLKLPCEVKKVENFVYRT